MKNILALVLAGGRVDELSVLTMRRPKSSLPFGGLYRVIDFPLSNLMNSGIEKVGILSQYRPFSLMEHISNGSSWDMYGRNRYIHILPPFKGHTPSDWYKGGADAVYQNIEFIKKENPEHVLILSGDHIYSMDYRDLYDFHRTRNADVTLAFKNVPEKEASRFGLARLSDDGPLGGRILDYAEKPDRPISTLASLTIYLFRTQILIDALEKYVHEQNGYDFARHILPELTASVNAYGYVHEGYWGYTRTLAEYYTTSMNLLGDQPQIDPEDWQIRTNLGHRKISDRMPACMYAGAKIQNSVFYNGCQIHGQVANSILFPGVVVEKGATVRNSIIFFDSTISEGAQLQHCIVDTDVHIGAKARLGSQPPITRRIEDDDLVVIGQHCRVEPGANIPAGMKISDTSSKSMI